MTDRLPDFIVVDDDEVNNMICEKVITRTIPGAVVISFTKPEAGLAFILSTFCDPDAGKATLLLDINMPTMTGWEFMNRFEKAGPVVKEKIFIYILSSSVNPVDKDRAANNNDVTGYIEKPLTPEFIKTLDINNLNNV